MILTDLELVGIRGKIASMLWAPSWLELLHLPLEIKLFVAFQLFLPLIKNGDEIKCTTTLVHVPRISHITFLRVSRTILCMSREMTLLEWNGMGGMQTC